MSIVEEVTAQMKDAMRAKDKQRLVGLRGIRAAFIVAMKEDGSDTLTDAKCIPVLRRLGKQRRDSIAAYNDAGRKDLAAAEQAELDVIETFLPQLADEATTRAWAAQAIADAGATEARHMGKAMGMLMKAHKADIDGGLARRILAELLAS